MGQILIGSKVSGLTFSSVVNFPIKILPFGDTCFSATHGDFVLDLLKEHPLEKQIFP